MQDVERDCEDLPAVLLRKIRDRSDQARARRAELRAPFGRRVLTHDRARLAASRLLERAQRAERARIVDRADEAAVRPARAQMTPHLLEALAQLAVAVDEPT